MKINMEKEIAKIESRYTSDVSEDVIIIMTELAKGVRRRVPDRFWEKKENRVGAFTMYLNGIPKVSVEEAIKGLRIHEVKGSVIRGLFTKYYGSSLHKMVSECCPDKVSSVHRRHPGFEIDFKDIWSCVDMLFEISSSLNKSVDRLKYVDIINYHAGSMFHHHSLEEIKEYCSIKKEGDSLCEL